MVVRKRLAASPNFLLRGRDTGRATKVSQVATITVVTVSGERGRGCGRGLGQVIVLVTAGVEMEALFYVNFSIVME